MKFAKTNWMKSRQDSGLIRRLLITVGAGVAPNIPCFLIAFLA